MSFNPEVNKIKELAPGVFWVLLWCPSSSMLGDLLRPDVGFVLCWEHKVGNYSWQEFVVPLVIPDEPVSVLSRLLSMEFVLPTKEFLKVLPRLRPAIKAVQLTKRPPDYFDLGRIKGKQLYRLLQECGWHVLMDTPANDYGEVMSSDPHVLERAIELSQQDPP